MISAKMTKALNQQIVHELYSSNAYITIAAWCDEKGLKAMAKRFFIQSDEERAHAMRFVNYILSVGAPLKVEAIPTTQTGFASPEKAVEAALEQEETVTAQINDLMTLANSENDYATAGFLQWFVDEQVEEIATTSELLQLVRLAGEERILMVEERLIRMGFSPDPPAEPAG